ncbi:MAG: glycosyltransferase family 4 protein [Pseudomonadota bacterium]
MKIALTADPDLLVPPKHYGGIERIVDMLARGLVARGHEVVLFAHRDSSGEGRRLIPWPGMASHDVGDTVKNAGCLTSEVMRGGFDVVHSFSRIAYLAPILPLSIPKIMTYQREISRRSVRWGHTLSRGTLSFTAISEWMMRDVRGIGQWALVPNGVPLDIYNFSQNVEPDAPLVFLGRIEEIKGPHLAIEIAKRTGRRLIIAGNIPPEKKDWVDANVLPHVDGTQIRYTGTVDDAQKNELLGSASAFLMPILWEEPFGIVMAEAMACGVPVLGLRRGAVPEVVQDGVTGFVRDTVDELVAATLQLDSLDRGKCRVRVETQYSADAVVDGYLSVYRTRLRKN